MQTTDSESKRTSKLPTFIVVGAPKCGTTSICAHLSRHPDVCFSTPKEPAFFSKDENYRRGIGWYASLFDGADDAKAIGEGTTGYSTSTYGEIAADRIAKTIPNVRIIYCTRHPIRRIESIWMEYVTSGVYGAQHDDVHIFKSFSKSVTASLSFVETSRYWARLRTYLDRFDESQIHLMMLEDLSRDPAGEMRKCLRFIGVDPSMGLAGVAEARNISANRRRLSRSGARLRSLVQQSKFGNLVPQGVRSLASRLFTSGPIARPNWDPRQLREIQISLRDDTRLFLAYAGKAADFWDL